MKWWKQFLQLFKSHCIVSATYEDGIMKVCWSDGSKGEYKGECTVWHRLPSMRRPGTLMESELCRLQDYIEYYGNPYRIDHANRKPIAK